MHMDRPIYFPFRIGSSWLEWVDLQSNMSPKLLIGCVLCWERKFISLPLSFSPSPIHTGHPTLHKCSLGKEANPCFPLNGWNNPFGGDLMQRLEDRPGGRVSSSMALLLLTD